MRAEFGRVVYMLVGNGDVAKVFQPDFAACDQKVHFTIYLPWHSILGPNADILDSYLNANAFRCYLQQSCAQQMRNARVAMTTHGLMK